MPPGLRPGARGKAAERSSRRPGMESRLTHRRAGSIDGGREDADQTTEADRRQVAAPDHGADGLLVPPEPARGVRNGEEEGRKAAGTGIASETTRAR